jgi:hypothetical protein
MTKTLFSETLLIVPSAKQFVGMLVDELAARRSLIILLPSSISPDEVWLPLQTELWHRSFNRVKIWLPDIPEEYLPIAAIAEKLEINWEMAEAPITSLSLMSKNSLPDIIQLEGFDQLSNLARKNWLEFIKRWARASQTIADRGITPTAICLITPGILLISDVPPSDLYLTIYWWWKFPSILETRLLCRLVDGDDHYQSVSRWRGQILPAIAGNDLDLIEYLWDEYHLSTSELEQKLCEFARLRGWTSTMLQAWGSRDFGAVTSRHHAHLTRIPPIKWNTLWAHGALVGTPEYGIELHTAALAILGRTDEIKHRVWRGQAELLLPLIDHMRLILCSYLTDSYGHDWPLRWDQPESPEEFEAIRSNPLACQWGYLERLLKKCQPLQGEHQWLRIASLARWIRNEIAHYRPITFHEFDDFWQQTKQINISVIY